MSPDSNDEGKREYRTFEIRPYKISELAAIYHINKLTFKGWIEDFRSQLGRIVGHYLSIPQVEIIFAHLKLPYFVKVEVVSEEKFDHTLEEKLKRLPTPAQKTPARKNIQTQKKKSLKKKKRKRRIQKSQKKISRKK
jgi:hypothetical protein